MQALEDNYNGEELEKCNLANTPPVSLLASPVILHNISVRIYGLYDVRSDWNMAFAI